MGIIARAQMSERDEDLQDVESTSTDSFINDSEDDDEPSTSGQEEFHAPLSDKEIEELVAEFLEVESKAAEAQEMLEKESLAKVEAEVSAELAQTLHGDDLENAVANEMETFKEEWEAALDELETESAHLLEQLDGAGVELPRLYKWIENQAPNGCSTEAWKKRAHWVGCQVNSDFHECITDAEKYLQMHRPVRRRHGKLLEEGASGFLARKLTTNNEVLVEKAGDGWESFNKMLSVSNDGTLFGSEEWASVYLASTPQQAALMGLKFPGVDEVEEINDVDGDSELDLSEEQKRNFKKVKEEDDVNVDRKLQIRLKQRRHRKRCKQEAVEKEVHVAEQAMEVDLDKPFPVNGHTHLVSSEEVCGDVNGVPDGNNQVSYQPETSNDFDEETQISESVLPDLTEMKGIKRSRDCEKLEDNKMGSTVVIDSDEEEMETRFTTDTCNVKNIGSDPVDSLPSSNQNVDFQCTGCGKVVSEVHAHPLLRVIVCMDCKLLIVKKMDLKDPDCSECYCGWCGRSDDLISCKMCSTLFCASCIKRNIGEECLHEAQRGGWRCCSCSPNILQRLTIEYDKAVGAGRLMVSSSDSDSDGSDSDIPAAISTKRRRKKKIRRILDDAELGEETKRKIAIEKERQERLKSLQAKSKMMNTATCNGTVMESSSVEVLGDSVKGYIVNVVREKGEEAVRIPPSISAKLKVHQIAGIRFMWENIIQSINKVKSGDKGLGCILAHTMGLGKTFQVIAFLYTAMRSIDLGLRTALIVAPVNVLHNWRQEFIKWRPVEYKPLRVFMLEDVSREKRVELLAKWRAKGGVFLIGYSAFRNLSLGKLVKDRQAAREICYSLQDGPDILVCDEAHMIKNTQADTTQALKQIRIALTGSPLQNNLMEYYCMVDFVREGFLGSSHEFRNRFQNPIVNGQHTNSTSEDVKIMNQRSHILYEQLKGFVQRMDMNVVKKDLPPKTVFVIAVKLSPLQRKLYKRFLDVHGFTKDRASAEKIGRRSFFAGYQALAQIWNHPGILQFTKEDREHVRREETVENFDADDSSSDDHIYVNGDKLGNRMDPPQRKSDGGFLQKGWWNNLLSERDYDEVDYSGKMVLLLDILTMSADRGDKTLVFSQFIKTLDLIEHCLSKLPRRGKKGKCWKQGKDWYRLDGRTEASERQKLVERFNEPLNNRVKCTLISTRAGSLGINLHAANRVIIVDGSWNPTFDLQAIYRAWRYGQKKPVFAYRLMAHGTMEEKIYKRQVTKEGLAARVVDRQQVHRTISKEDLLHLFEFGDEENAEMLPGFGQEYGHAMDQHLNGEIGNPLKQKFNLSNGGCTSDKLMESLLSKHHPRWIANYHEHETLLQENEEEKLSKEEQDMAWEVYRRTFEWEEVQQVPPEVSILERKPVESNGAVPTQEDSYLPRPRGILRYQVVPRKCTNLSHLLTLRSQGTKPGCTTVCGECAQELSLEILKKNSSSPFGYLLCCGGYYTEGPANARKTSMSIQISFIVHMRSVLFPPSEENGFSTCFKLILQYEGCSKVDHVPKLKLQRMPSPASYDGAVGEAIEEFLPKSPSSPYNSVGNKSKSVSTENLTKIGRRFKFNHSKALTANLRQPSDTLKQEEQAYSSQKYTFLY
ncbi:SNF2, N-terminal [Dillenia turbinata]|uniref:ATP-dependent helicase ATRX n=1 Tax=Dillenia turbinata TaxID=194707 RepID=A0AAN8UTQ8_9MAGN